MAKLEEITFCKKCDVKEKCFNKEDLSNKFLNWDKYIADLAVELKIDRPSSCDLIYNKYNIIYYIEHKGLNRFNNGKEFNILKKELENKIYNSIKYYSKINLKIKDSYYLVLFSKKIQYPPEENYKNKQIENLQPSLVKRFIENRIFRQFENFQMADKTFLFNDIKVYLKAGECS